MKLNFGHIIALVAFLAWSVAPSVAETRTLRDSMAHELRVGWGDQLFETLCWHEYSASPGAVLPDYSALLRSDFHYYQHWFVEYQYRYNSWLGLGWLVDGSGVTWQDRDYQYFYNITFMPTVRFTYLLREYVSLYSGFGLGANINSGTETDLRGRHTGGGVAVNLTLLGLQVGHGRWFGALEIGGLYALQNPDVLFMVNSRLFTASVGVHF